MKWAASRFAWLLPVVLCACSHRVDQSQMQPLAPPIEDTPPPPPDSAPSSLPAPVYSLPKTPEPVVVQQEPPKPPPRHRRSKSSAGAQGSSAASQNQVAAEAPPTEVSAIGQFATPEAPDSKKQAENSIAEIEKGLNSLGRRLNDQETKTSTQIREFLKQARTALNSGDVDGAKTLTAKAKALLGELSQ